MFQPQPTPVTTTMPASDTPHLQNLLTRFDVERLGEGDLAAGAYLLAAMACSLATSNVRAAASSPAIGRRLPWAPASSSGSGADTEVTDPAAPATGRLYRVEVISAP